MLPFNTTSILYLAFVDGLVWDHAHLLLGISPGETPEEAALALLNNVEL